MSTIFIDELQAGNILLQMWQQSETDQFCDVMLIAGAEVKKIPAHRSVLSTATEYFKKKFLESREKEVKITEVDGPALKSLIQFIYTGRVEIREDNVKELLKTADMLFLNNVVQACGKFLAEQLDPANYLDFMLLAEQFQFQSLIEYVEEYSLEHFMDVYKTQEFLKFNTEQLSQLLANDNLTSEEHVFNSLLLWLEHDRREREKYKDGLLKLVRMPLLDPKFLNVHVKPVCTSTESRQLYSEVLEWYLFQDPSVLCLSISIKPRISSQYLMGITLNSENKQMYIHYYCPKQHKWMRWMKDLMYREEFAVATLGNNIYIAGGRNAMGNVLNTVICLNLKTMILSRMTVMKESREGCSAAVLNGFLYVVGGYDGRSYLSSVERWDPKTNAWSKVDLMLVGRFHFGIAELNKKLYVVGGSDRHGALNSAEYYDADKNVWTSIAWMSQSRWAHEIAVANGHLYAVGGDERKTVERFDAVKNQWSTISSLRGRHLECYSCTAFHDKVVVCYEDRVDEYDATTNEWKTKESLKGLPNLCYVFTYSGELLTAEFAEN